MATERLLDDASLVERARAMRAAGATYAQIKSELGVGTSTVSRHVRALTDHELLLVGAVAYWAEGTKAKPWRRQDRLSFTNSDANMIRLFLAWLDLVGVKEERLSYRVQIHESADIEGAVRFWATIAGVSEQAFSKTTVKRHNPMTNRHNTGDVYHGCLVIRVRRSAEEYRLAEGLRAGIVSSLDRLGGGTPLDT
jgi:hypothetical protein